MKTKGLRYGLSVSLIAAVFMLMFMVSSFAIIGDSTSSGGSAAGTATYRISVYATLDSKAWSPTFTNLTATTTAKPGFTYKLTPVKTSAGRTYYTTVVSAPGTYKIQAPVSSYAPKTLTTTAYTVTVSATNKTGSVTLPYFSVKVVAGTGIKSVSGARSYVLKGQSVTVSAVAKEGYTFSKWSGTASSTAKSYKITGIAKPYTLTASAALNRLRMTYYIPEGASMSSSTYKLSKSTYGAIYLKSTNNYYRQDQYYNTAFKMKSASSFGLSKKGYTLTGWALYATYSDCGRYVGKTYKVGESVTPLDISNTIAAFTDEHHLTPKYGTRIKTQNVVVAYLMPVWTANGVTVTLKMNGSNWSSCPNRFMMELRSHKDGTRYSFVKQSSGYAWKATKLPVGYYDIFAQWSSTSSKLIPLGTIDVQDPYAKYEIGYNSLDMKVYGGFDQYAIKVYNRYFQGQELNDSEFYVLRGASKNDSASYISAIRNIWFIGGCDIGIYGTVKDTLNYHVGSLSGTVNQKEFYCETVESKYIQGIDHIFNDCHEKLDLTLSAPRNQFNVTYWIGKDTVVKGTKFVNKNGNLCLKSTGSVYRQTVVAKKGEVYLPTADGLELTNNGRTFAGWRLCIKLPSGTTLTTSDKVENCFAGGTNSPSPLTISYNDLIFAPVVKTSTPAVIHDFMAKTGSLSAYFVPIWN